MSAEPSEAPIDLGDLDIKEKDEKEQVEEDACPKASAGGIKEASITIRWVVDSLGILILLGAAHRDQGQKCSQTGDPDICTHPLFLLPVVKALFVLTVTLRSDAEVPLQSMMDKWNCFLRCRLASFLPWTIAYLLKK